MPKKPVTTKAPAEPACDALADESCLVAIAAEAWRRVSDYVRRGRFVDDMAFLFEPSH